jgi:transcriptional regulator with XRE-family HTH domain
MPLSAEQIRAARALLGWSQSDLADRTLLGMRTVKRAEAGDRLTAAADLSIRRALEQAGVAFLGPDEVVGLEVIAGVALVVPKR